MTKAAAQVIDWKRERTKIIERYQNGESLRDIASTYGIGFSTVNKWLSRWGIPRRNGKARQRKLVIDLVGNRYGRLVVEAQDTSKYPTYWWCRCDCGKLVSVKGDRLRRNKTCGCGRRSK